MANHNEIIKIDIDDCVDNPCVNGGACIDKLNDYECQCQYGYSGPTCEDFEGSGSVRVKA